MHILPQLHTYSFTAARIEFGRALGLVENHDDKEEAVLLPLVVLLCDLLDPCSDSLALSFT